jgi:hypothetical protein
LETSPADPPQIGAASWRGGLVWELFGCGNSGCQARRIIQEGGSDDGRKKDVTSDSNQKDGDDGGDDDDDDHEVILTMYTDNPI